MSKNSVLTAIAETETRGPRLTANWNSGDCCIACRHAKVWVKSVSSCQIK